MELQIYAKESKEVVNVILARLYSIGQYGSLCRFFGKYYGFTKTIRIEQAKVSLTYRKIADKGRAGGFC